MLFIADIGILNHCSCRLDLKTTLVERILLFYRLDRGLHNRMSFMGFKAVYWRFSLRYGLPVGGLAF